MSAHNQKNSVLDRTLRRAVGLAVFGAVLAAVSVQSASARDDHRHWHHRAPVRVYAAAPPVVYAPAPAYYAPPPPPVVYAPPAGISFGINIR
jgi:hypothetical protein